jgi:hypothetical protein
MSRDARGPGNLILPPVMDDRVVGYLPEFCKLLGFPSRKAGIVKHAFEAVGTALRNGEDLVNPARIFDSVGLGTKSHPYNAWMRTPPSISVERMQGAYERALALPLLARATAIKVEVTESKLGRQPVKTGYCFSAALDLGAAGLLPTQFAGTLLRQDRGRMIDDALRGMSIVGRLPIHSRGEESIDHLLESDVLLANDWTGRVSNLWRPDPDADFEWPTGNSPSDSLAEALFTRREGFTAPVVRSRQWILAAQPDRHAPHHYFQSVQPRRKDVPAIPWARKGLEMMGRGASAIETNSLTSSDFPATKFRAVEKGVYFGDKYYLLTRTFFLGSLFGLWLEQRPLQKVPPSPRRSRQAPGARSHPAKIRRHDGKP